MFFQQVPVQMSATSGVRVRGPALRASAPLPAHPSQAVAPAPAQVNTLQLFVKLQTFHTIFA